MPEASIAKEAKLPQHHSVEYHGIPVVIEWPKGCVREGKDKNGRTWRREMKADYGYIDDTSAKGDAEPLDIYIGGDKEASQVFVIEQLDEDGEFDEYKLVAGVPNLESAQKLYLSHYPKEWGDSRLGDCFETDIGSLRSKVEEHQEKDKDMKKTSADEGILERIKGTEYDMAGSKLTGFWHDGPATCMDCRHRTPHSKNAEGVEVDSCKHPVVMADPELQEKKLPDGTIEVDADDWCRFAQKPAKKEEKSEPAKPETSEKLEKKPMTGSIYFKVLNSMR
jgi:hypothetical protein